MEMGFYERLQVGWRSTWNSSLVAHEIGVFLCTALLALGFLRGQQLSDELWSIGITVGAALVIWPMVLFVWNTALAPMGRAKQRVAALEEENRGLRNIAAINTPQQPTWFDLEARFKEMREVLMSAWIHGQTGVDSGGWYLQGYGNATNRARVEVVAGMAGNKLRQDFPSLVVQHEDMASESDPTKYWYKALWYIADRADDQILFWTHNEDGTANKIGVAGHIHRPAEVSETFCLRLASRPREST